ncbi:MATE family efflux transporter [Deltaproteobacteria bacterium]|nr:MATE family efflux transporter [Deltaproteobacteria bacterium]
MDQKQSVLDDDRIGRLLLKLAFPAFIGVFFTAMYNIVDTFFIGRFVGSIGIAGISIVFPVQMLSMGIGMMFGVGGASLISRSIGSGEIDKAERVLGNALISAVVLLVILLIVGLSNRDYWLTLMGASENVLPHSRDYLTIILFGLIFQTLAMAMNGLIMSEGNGRVAMTGIIIGALSNIILDALFIVFLKMGVKGAAIGTVIAQFLAVLFLTSYYYSGNSFVKIRFRNMIIKWNILKEIIAVGSSSFMTTIASSLSVIFLNRMLVAYGGDIAVSAYGIINRLIIFIAMPGISIAQGLQPILGFNYSVGRYDRVLRLLEIVLVCLTCFGIVMFGVLFSAPEIFIRIFTNESELLAMGSYAGKFVFSSVFFTGFIISGAFIFQALGKASIAFVINLRPLIFLLPLVLILPRFFRLEGVFLAWPLTEFFGFVLAMSMVIPQIREFRRMAMSEVGSS